MVAPKEGMVGEAPGFRILIARSRPALRLSDSTVFCCHQRARPNVMTQPPTRPTSPVNEPGADDFVRQLVEHRHGLYAFIAKQVVNPADAEDLFQRTSMILWQKRGRYDGERSFFSWACGIAYNEIRNHLTVNRRRRLSFDPDLVQTLAQEAVKEEGLSEARLKALRFCLGRLDEHHRNLLRRCYQGALSITEIAASLGRSRDALYKQLGRLRNKLLTCIRGRLKCAVGGP